MEMRRSVYCRCLLAFFPPSICSQHILILYCFPLSALMLVQIWNKFSTQRCYVVCISSFPGASDVWFSLNGTTYQNNSIVTLEDIGEQNDDALLCKTNLTTCCQSSNTGGNWFFPNGTRVAGTKDQQDFHRTRGQMVLHLIRNPRIGGEVGIYHCEMPDSMNVTQTIYIGVYTATTGE